MIEINVYFALNFILAVIFCKALEVKIQHKFMYVNIYMLIFKYEFSTADAKVKS